MPLKMTSRIGRTPIEIEGKDLKELFEQTELLCQIPQACACGSDNIVPGYSKNSGYEFYFIKCHDCHKEFKFGIRKDDHGLFPKFDEGDNGWVEPYSGGAKQKTGSYSTPSKAGKAYGSSRMESKDSPFREGADEDDF